MATSKTKASPLGLDLVRIAALLRELADELDGGTRRVPPRVPRPVVTEESKARMRAKCRAKGIRLRSDQDAAASKSEKWDPERVKRMVVTPEQREQARALCRREGIRLKGDP